MRFLRTGLILTGALTFAGALIFIGVIDACESMNSCTADSEILQYRPPIFVARIPPSEINRRTVPGCRRSFLATSSTVRYDSIAINSIKLNPIELRQVTSNALDRSSKGTYDCIVCDEILSNTTEEIETSVAVHCRDLSTSAGTSEIGTRCGAGWITRERRAEMSIKQARTIVAKRDIVGKKFNRLTIIEQVIPGKKSVVKCECGTEKSVDTWSVVHGHIKSCGCMTTERTAAGGPNVRHGDSRPGKRTPEYRAWSQMINRCTNERCPSFRRYGGRGIRVCERWLRSFECFLSDMGRRPGLGYSVERQKNDGDYAPSNCTWATKKQQANNRHTSHRVSAFGETLTIAEWSDRTKINQTMILKRLRRGWNPEAAVSEPSRRTA